MISGPAAVTRRTPRAEVRDRLLRAASTVFAERGFAGATMQQVAATAGFTTGALYSNFASKDDLFFELFDREVTGRIAAVRAILGQANLTVVNEATAHAAGQQLTAAMQHNREWQLLFTEFWLRAIRDAQLRERWVEKRRDYHRQLTELADEALAGWGADAAISSRTLMFTMLALNNGLAIEELADPGSVPADTIGTVLVRLLGIQSKTTG
ncbi:MULTISPECIES: TetR/AcrR family transcriptional regulator [Mycobacteriaceae]|uniref:TetR/AcrR family transcriptional regulator n=1 Tax=Mycolicibacterium mucogenicum DSM 44124 TaxID=1226753 RepID=A0A8H2JGU9_MYCMU|nr:MULTISPECIES: TetR/AcrR family transcriptional regulator [Mycobacteriaceae]KAB7754816.1 TetR family transcriptional regulator [Mycolicibacterium mucogenicum DSM 44124]QPG69409.1 TetR/AcrR family transcriptional regulator [Mycolicibacterium mucogenicum DSM 44124]SEB17076.1 DNA-binding transcriptional regulator, AcrR family [Mycobacterium sp. 283mftsu]